MRPDPNELAQGMIRILKSEIAPNVRPGAAAMVNRIAAILRDTDWSGAREIAVAESARLRFVLTDLSARGVLEEIVPGPPDRTDHATLSADVNALRGLVGRTAARLASRRDPALDDIRVELAEAMADCAGYGLNQTSAPDGHQKP